MIPSIPDTAFEQDEIAYPVGIKANQVRALAGSSDVFQSQRLPL